MAQLAHWERAGQVAEWHAAHPHAITAPGEWAPLTSSSDSRSSLPSLVVYLARMKAGSLPHTFCLPPVARNSTLCLFRD